MRFSRNVLQRRRSQREPVTVEPQIIVRESPQLTNTLRVLAARGHGGPLSRSQVLHDLILGLVFAAMTLAVGFALDSRIAERQNDLEVSLARISVVNENVRFVRTIVMDPSASRPFDGLDLRGASLSGLMFSCADEVVDRGGLRSCLNLSRSNLTGADLTGGDFTDGNLSRATFDYAFALNSDVDRVVAVDGSFVNAVLEKSSIIGSSFSGSDFSGASLHTSYLYGSHFTCAWEGNCVSLVGADLWGSDLRMVDFTGADLSGADLGETCFDETTVWPTGMDKSAIPAQSNPRYCADESWLADRYIIAKLPMTAPGDAETVD